MKNLKKLAAILLALVMVLALAGCGGETEGENPDVQPDAADAQPEDTEPEAPKEEPPIEISEFGDPEEMPQATDSGEYPAEFTSDDYAITVGDRSFTLQWLYEQNIHDWIQAGITFDQIDEKTDSYLALPLTAEAIEALKTKISDFTQIVFMGTTAEAGIESVAPIITVGDQEYGLDWMTSHNATEYTEAGIDANVVSQYLDALADYSYTPEYRWIKEVHNRLVNGW